MASRIAFLRSRSPNSVASIFETRRWNHFAAIPPSMAGSTDRAISSPPFVLPEANHAPEVNTHIGFGFGFPSYAFTGSMELMAVPKRKTTPHKRGIRNGPKALKPVPVIVRCLTCGRVKLPHFYCCSGRKGIPGEREI